MSDIVLAVLLALVFYAVLPLIGAHKTRSRWRRFRHQIIHSSAYPLYPDPSGIERRESSLTPCRFFGQLEALEEEDIIWLSDGTHRVRVDLSDTSVFVLPGHNLSESAGAGENNPNVVKWDSMGSMPQGTEFFVTGMLCHDTLVPVFQSDPEYPLLVIIHDMPRSLFLSRAIRTGRQRNEFWNVVTPVSLLSGVMTQLLIILNLLQRDPTSLLLFILVPLAILPGLILAPPGIFLYVLYRNSWKRGRKFREERDLLRLVLRYPENSLPDGGKYRERILDAIPSSAGDGAEVRVRHVMAAQELHPTAHSPVKWWYFKPEMSEDPFAEELYIQGNPEVLAQVSHRRAGALERLSIVFFSLGISVNIFLIEILMLLFWF